jgi:putative SOS response-associated peptidase YedK
MCGRYELIDGQRVFMRFRVTNKVPPILDNGDVRPTQQVFALQTDHVLSLMKWGLVPSWAKDPSVGSKMINARAEGIESKPSFKKPLRYQRCIIPASAFFEWKGNPGAKAKYRTARKDGDLFGFASLYEHWRDPNTDSELATCTIITTQPNELVAPIHNRMPVILLPEDEDHWLDPDMSEPEEIVSLLRPYPADLMMASRA